ncbi:MAG: hypothetical protein ACI9I4_002315 [Neolewinella sp.]|jgi:hypothetical protein
MAFTARGQLVLVEVALWERYNVPGKGVYDCCLDYDDALGVVVKASQL